MEEALIAILLDDGDVTALVGNRVQPVVRPQASALPSITVQRISGISGYHMLGPDGLVSSRIQVDAWGRTYAEAKTTARSVIAAVSGLRGDYYGVSFGGVFIESEADDFEAGGQSQAGTPERFYRTRVDLSIWHAQELGAA